MESYLISQFVVLAAAHFLAVASPGPDFAVVIKQSISFGKRNAVYTSLGIGSAILVHVAYSALGIAILLKQSPWLFTALKYICAAYLVYIGIKSLQAKPSTDDGVITGAVGMTQESFKSSFRLGFITNVLNPKATLFFLSIFSVVVASSTPSLWLGIYAFYLSMATALWFCFVSMIFSQQRVRKKFLAMGHYFDWVMGVILILLALKVALF